MNALGNAEDMHSTSATFRNATGFYAGQDSSKSKHAGMPSNRPLSMNRGRPFLRKTPTEELRQVHIENIREQKTYRGFSGSKVKILQRPKSAANFIVTGGQRQPPSWEELHYMSKKSLGSTSANVLHSEKIRRPSPPASAADTVELLSRELERTVVHEQLVGLHDCYRRICKGSTRSLFALLVGSSRRHVVAAGGSLSAAVGLSCPSFSVRGYGSTLASHNENRGGSASIPAPRPSTAGSGRSLLVPQPLFLKRFIEPFKINPGIQAHKPLLLPEADLTQSQAGTNIDQTKPKPAQDSQQLDDMRRALPASPTLLSPELCLTQAAGACGEPSDAVGENEAVQSGIRTRPQSPASPLSRHSSPSRAEPIGINVETDDGDAAPPEIDDVDDEAIEALEPVEEPVLPTNMNVRRQSITERLQKLRLGEFVANAIKEEAEERKKVLKDLMSEHEYLVKIVNTSNIVLH